MLTPWEIMAVAFAEPFQPFKIKMTSGKAYEIRHPEIFQLGRSSLAVFTPLLGEPEKDQPWKKLSYLHVESIEPLEPATSRSPGESLP